MSHLKTSIYQFQTLMRQDTDGRWIHVMAMVSYLTNIFWCMMKHKARPNYLFFIAGWRFNPLQH